MITDPKEEAELPEATAEAVAEADDDGNDDDDDPTAID